jgi:hypothetical protein
MLVSDFSHTSLASSLSLSWPPTWANGPIGHLTGAILAVVLHSHSMAAECLGCLGGSHGRGRGRGRGRGLGLGWAVPLRLENASLRRVFLPALRSNVQVTLGTWLQATDYPH